MEQNTEYDVAFSFAGEDREYVEEVVKFIRKEGVSVFFDRSEEVNLWGKDLAVALDDVYRKKARFVVLFVSNSYLKKAWTTFERGSVLAGAIERIGQDFILPARFDETDIPGLNPNISYIELRNYTPQEFSFLIIEKIRDSKVSVSADGGILIGDLLDGYVEKEPFLEKSELLDALDLKDWPESVSVGIFSSAPKPSNINELQVESIKEDVLYQIVLITQSEWYYTFKLACRPSREARGRYLSLPNSHRGLDPVSFGSGDRHDEYVEGDLDYSSCDACEGVGTVSSVCQMCSGKGELDWPYKVRCHGCKEGRAISVCGKCGGAGFLDVFPMAGRVVKATHHVVCSGVRSGVVEEEGAGHYHSVWEGQVLKSLPVEFPFSGVDPDVAAQYDAVLAVVRRQDLPVNPVAVVREGSSAEAREMSVRESSFSGCRFLVEMYKKYDVSYSRLVAYSKGFFHKDEIRIGIAGSFSLYEDGGVKKINGSHKEHIIK